MKQTITLKKQNIHIGNLILVNADFPIVRPFHPPLVPVESSYAAIMLQRTAAALLAGALDEVGAGGRIVPVSGYRPLREQRQIYEDSLKENGREFTEKYVALPDHSEHQTGLAIDLGENRDEIDFIRPDFPYEGICQEFRRQAADYGFVERYQKEKVSVTRIAHEPWHFRYVGCPHAALMNEHGMALEEYIPWLRQFPCDGKHLFTGNGRYEAEIFFVPMIFDNRPAMRTVRLALPPCTAYQVSGNNIDGCIITLWRRQPDGQTAQAGHAGQAGDPRISPDSAFAQDERRAG